MKKGFIIIIYLLIFIHAHSTIPYVPTIGPAKIQVGADLYVSPGGDNANSGLSFDQALKTITFALYKIQADSLHPQTIYLANGVYSPSTNSEIFPLALKSHVSLVGTDETTTILDAESSNQVIDCSSVQNVEIKNMTIRNGSRQSGDGGGLLIIEASPHIENVTITQCSAYNGGGILIHYYSNPHLINVTIRDNLSFLSGHSGHSVGGGGILIRAFSAPIFTNVLVERNTAQRGGGIRCDEWSAPQINQSVIRNNYAQYYGGGLYFRHSDPLLDQVVIEGNTCERSAGGLYSLESNLILQTVFIRENAVQQSGGGLYAEDSDLEMRNVSISRNLAGHEHGDWGGGIYCKNSNLNFNDSDRSRIYLNQAGFGNDMYTDTPVTAILDTFTVARPTTYHIFPYDYFTFDILNGKLEQVEHDIYVSPTGDNDNSGLTADFPLQTIDRAMAKIYADSIHPATIHLSEGIYSESANQERLPVYGLNYVALSGSGENTTIIDAEGITDALYFDNNHDCRIENILLIDGNRSNIYTDNCTLSMANTSLKGSRQYGIYSKQSFLTLEDVTITNNDDEGLLFFKTNGVVTNAQIRENGAGIQCSDSDLTLTQTEISTNKHYGLSCGTNSKLGLCEVVIRGNQGIGVFCSESEGQLSDVIIEENLGGGLRCNRAIITLANVTITRNQTPHYGGGIYLENKSHLFFNPDDLCNIYLNRAGVGKDVYSQGCPLTQIIVDTFTVIHPNNYFACPIDSLGFTVQNGKTTQVKADLFVSPNGDDQNAGTSPEHPLKTIDMAQTKIDADSQHPRTIQLAAGVYSASRNDEFFPINCQSYVSIVGAGETQTILDAEENTPVLNCFYTHQTSLQHVTLQNGNGMMGAGMYIAYSDPQLNGVRIIHNCGVGIHCDHANPKLMRVIIADNQPNELWLENAGGIHCYDSNPELVHVTMTRNVYKYVQHVWEMLRTSFYCQNSSPVIINSIFWDNSANAIYCVSNTTSDSITILHSNIQDGDSAIVTQGDIRVNWLSGNIDSDPMFLDPENDDFSLLENSPCIEAGTASFFWYGDTLIHLPDSCYSGTAPDMGALESSYITAVDTHQYRPHQFELYQNYPNPFNAITTFSFQLPKTTFVTLTIFNIAGHEVEILLNEKMEQGYHRVQWNTDYHSSGLYLYRITADTFSATGKCLLLK